MRISYIFIVLVSLFCISSANAAPLSFWSTQGWTMVDNDDGVGLNGFVDPGWGGQDFDGGKGGADVADAGFTIARMVGGWRGEPLGHADGEIVVIAHASPETGMLAR